MKNKTTQLSPSESWSQAKRSEVQEASTEDSDYVLARAFLNGATSPEQTRSRLTELVQQKVDLTPFLSLMVNDTRQPGWLRLSAALMLGDSNAIEVFAKHSAALASQPSRFLRQVTVSHESLMLLSPQRRVRLVLAGVHTANSYRVKHLAPRDLVSVVSASKNMTWFPADCGSLPRQVAWNDASVADVVAVLAALRPLVSTSTFPNFVKEVLDAYSSVFTSENGRNPLMALAIDSLESADADLAVRLSAEDFATVADILLEDPRLGARRLLRSLASCHGGYSRKYLTRFAADPVVAPSLTSYGMTTELTLDELCEVLEVLVVAKTLDYNLIRHFVEKARAYCKSETSFQRLYDALGKSSWVLAESVSFSLALVYDYTVLENDQTLMESLPAVLVEEIVQAPWLEDSSLPRLGDCSQKVSLATAVLVKNRHLLQLKAPRGPINAVTKTALVGALCFELLVAARKDHGQGPAHEDLVAWVNALPASAIPELMDESVRELSRCGAGSTMRPELTKVLDTSWALLQEDPVSEQAFLDAFAPKGTSGWFNGLPSDMTLSKFAQSLHNTVAHLDR